MGSFHKLVRMIEKRFDETNEIDKAEFLEMKLEVFEEINKEPNNEEFEPCGCDKACRTFCEKHYNEMYEEPKTEVEDD